MAAGDTVGTSRDTVGPLTDIARALKSGALRGPAGPTGPTGPAGATGATGPHDALWSDWSSFEIGNATSYDLVGISQIPTDPAVANSTWFYNLAVECVIYSTETDVSRLLAHAGYYVVYDGVGDPAAIVITNVTATNTETAGELVPGTVTGLSFVVDGLDHPLVRLLKSSSEANTWTAKVRSKLTTELFISSV